MVRHNKNQVMFPGKDAKNSGAGWFETYLLSYVEELVSYQARQGAQRKGLPQLSPEWIPIVMYYMQSLVRRRSGTLVDI